MTEHGVVQDARQTLQSDLTAEPAEIEMDAVYVEETPCRVGRGADIEEAKQAALNEERQDVFVMVGETVIEGQEKPLGGAARFKCSEEFLARHEAALVSEPVEL